ncbi:MAG: rod shape-determining protein MreC [Pseudomonadota bacterium]|nr:rod shape-determining protein MreC [Pseudomonadota bacterium]
MFLGYVIAVAGILFAVLLLILAAVDPRGFSALRGAALDATTPVSSGGRSIVRFFAGGGQTIGNYFMAASQNAELKRQLEASRRRVIEARAVEFENRRLKQLLNISESLSDKVTTARIVGSSFDSSRRLATLSAGGSSGVRPGQPVRGPEGLIGRVLETGRYASRVLLITDGASSVPVQLVRSGVAALATGRGNGTIELKTLEVGESPFKRGDLVVTSGVGGIYPPGIPVAVVIETNRDVTIARPIADPARIDFAIVQQLYQPAAALPVNAAEAAQQQEASQ